MSTPSTALLLLSFAVSLRAAFNFNNFPIYAQSVLYTFAPASCDYGDGNNVDTVRTDNCLCTNLGFLHDSALNIFQACGCQDLQTSAQVISNNCAKYQTNSALSVEDYINAGSSTCSNSKGPLDAGVIVGIVFGVLSLFPIALGFLQLFVALGWIRQSAAPWPRIKRAFKRCFPCL